LGCNGREQNSKVREEGRLGNRSRNDLFCSSTTNSIRCRYRQPLRVIHDDCGPASQDAGSYLVQMICRDAGKDLGDAGAVDCPQRSLRWAQAHYSPSRREIFGTSDG